MDNNSSTMQNNRPGTNQDSNARANKNTVGQVVISYTKGIGKSIKQICGRYGIQVHLRGNTPIKQVLMKPKDQNPKDNKSGVIYSYQCNHLDCNEEYIGEPPGPLGKEKKNILNSLHLSMGISNSQAMASQRIVST